MVVLQDLTPAISLYTRLDRTLRKARAGSPAVDLDRQADVTSKIAELLAEGAGELDAVLAGDRQDGLAFARRILRKKFEVQEPWRSRFEALGREPQFQDVQVRRLEPFFRRAVALADEYGLRSERGLALCFNIIFVQGGIRGTAKDDINAALVAFERERQRQPSEVERMHIIADAVTKSSLLQGYIGARYLLIANGGGSTPGVAVDLNERGIRLIDFRTGQPISEATTG
jgi:hypothetical protein